MYWLFYCIQAAYLSCFKELFRIINIVDCHGNVAIKIYPHRFLLGSKFFNPFSCWSGLTWVVPCSCQAHQGLYSSRKTLLNSSKDCRIKQKIGTPDTGLRWISLWSPKHEQTWLLYKPNRVLSWTGTSVMLSWIYTTTIFTFLFKSNQISYSPP